MSTATIREMNSPEYAKETLSFLKQGETVHGIIRSVSASGMSRVMSFVVADKDSNGVPYIRNITHSVAKIIGRPCLNYHGQNAIRISGCGMDMIFKVVYDLSSELFGDGYALRSNQL